MFSVLEFSQTRKAGANSVCSSSSPQDSNHFFRAIKEGGGDGEGVQGTTIDGDAGAVAAWGGGDGGATLSSGGAASSSACCVLSRS